MFFFKQLLGLATALHAFFHFARHQKSHIGSQSRLRETELNIVRVTKSKLKSERQSFMYNISQI